MVLNDKYWAFVCISYPVLSVARKDSFMLLVRLMPDASSNFSYCFPRRIQYFVESDLTYGLYALRLVHTVSVGTDPFFKILSTVHLFVSHVLLCL